MIITEDINHINYISSWVSIFQSEEAKIRCHKDVSGAWWDLIIIRVDDDDRPLFISTTEDVVGTFSYNIHMSSLPEHQQEFIKEIISLSRL